MYPLRAFVVDAHVPGRDIAGTIDDVGDGVDGLSVGEESSAWSTAAAVTAATASSWPCERRR